MKIRLDEFGCIFEQSCGSHCFLLSISCCKATETVDAQSKQRLDAKFHTAVLILFDQPVVHTLQVLESVLECKANTFAQGKIKPFNKPKFTCNVSGLLTI